MAAAARDRWDAQYSRFFNCPKPSSTTFARFQSIPKRKRGPKDGCWIAAETPAAVDILGSGVISVSVAGFVVEEHYVSSLHFSWPQVSCVSQCPIRGSRTVLLSYRNSSSEFQKFAVRFPTCDLAENFLNIVKEYLCNITDIVPSGCDIVCENSSPPGFSTSKRLHYSDHRLDDELSYEEPIATHSPPFPALTYHAEPAERALTPLLANNIDTLFSGLPPSFTELLTNCFTDTCKEQSAAGGNAKCKLLNEEPSLNSPVNGGALLPYFASDADLKTQIVKYMTDATFNDMLVKIEQVIDEMGGDLSL